MKFIDRWIHKTAEVAGGNVVKGASCEVKKIVIDYIPFALMMLSALAVGKSVAKNGKKEEVSTLFPQNSRITMTVNNYYYSIDKEN